MLLEAVKLLVYAESLLPKRNHKFIHRRALLNFELAKKFFDEEISQTYIYLDEAKDLFVLKQQIDPSSSYSYYDYLTLLIWELDNVDLSDEDQLLLKIQIEDNFTLALNAISEGVNKIRDLQEKYSLDYQYQTDPREYVDKLYELYDDINLRPYACILLFNYYNTTSTNNDKKDELISELWYFKDQSEVAIFLFREFGRKLYNNSIREKFFELSSEMEYYKSQNPLRYYYFLYVAESYNRNFNSARNLLMKIKDLFFYLNPEYNLRWMKSDGLSERVFEGHIIKEKNKFLQFRCKELQKSFKFTRDNYIELVEGENCKVTLRFYLTGIRAFLYKE